MGQTMSASEKTTPPLPPLLLLPQDILVKILSKLPAKSLLRIRCVSKFFYALIVDHGFGVLHRTLSLALPSRAAILIAITPRKKPLFAAYYTINFSEENPLGTLQANRLGYLDAQPFVDGSLRSSSDGLICLSRPKGDDDVFVVCNVSTGQRISLPPAIQSHPRHPLLSCALLGFDSQSKRYKVLMIARSTITGGECKHWVLTVGVDKSWREIDYPYSFTSHPFYPFDCFACPKYSDTSVHIDGIIYSFNWLTKDDPPNFHIVAFEVGSETYSLIPFPPEVSSSSSQYQCTLYVLGNFALLQVDGGRLAIVLVRQIGDLCYMDVWIWEKSKECWEKITMIIPLEEGSSILRSLRYTTNHAGEIVVLCINRKQLSVLVCNLKNEVWRKFDVGGVVEDLGNIYRVNVKMCRTMDNVFSLE